MDRPTVQEVVSMGRVMVVAVPVQDSKAIKPDMAIKAVRVTRAVIIIRGAAAATIGLSQSSEAIE